MWLLRRFKSTWYAGQTGKPAFTINGILYKSHGSEPADKTWQAKFNYNFENNLLKRGPPEFDGSH